MDKPNNQELDRTAVELWQKPRAEVRERLVIHYTPFAETLAQTSASRNRKVDYDDCLQEALIGLMTAVDRYDPNSGVAFTTFAFTRVCGGAIEAARKNDWVSHKIRSEDKRRRKEGQKGTVPVKVRLIGDHDVSVRDQTNHEAAHQRVQKMMESMSDWQRRWSQCGLDHDWDIDRMLVALDYSTAETSVQSFAVQIKKLKRMIQEATFEC